MRQPIHPGEIGVAVVNNGTTGQQMKIKFKNFNSKVKYFWYSLERTNDNGEFSRKVFVNGLGPTQIAGGPDNYTTIKARAASASGGVRLSVPPRGALFVMFSKK